MVNKYEFAKLNRLRKYIVLVLTINKYLHFYNVYKPKCKRF